jgi:hypothetical protein
MQQDNDDYSGAGCVLIIIALALISWAMYAVVHYQRW